MSRVRQTDWDRKALSASCPTCDAKPETWCKTFSGQWASALHMTRWFAYWNTQR